MSRIRTRAGRAETGEPAELQPPERLAGAAELPAVAPELAVLAPPSPEPAADLATALGELARAVRESLAAQAQVKEAVLETRRSPGVMVLPDGNRVVLAHVDTYGPVPGGVRICSRGRELVKVPAPTAQEEVAWLTRLDAIFGRIP